MAKAGDAMLVPVPELQRACVAEEAILGQSLQRLALLFQPPLTRASRAALRDGLAEAETRVVRLSWLWGQNLLLPAMNTLSPRHPDRVFFDSLRLRLAQWPAIAEALHRVILHAPLPLLPDLPSPDSAMAVQAGLQDRIWRRVHRAQASPGPQPAIRANGQYEDIPYPVQDFLRQMQLARRVGVALGKAQLRFLDVGCGTGLKVMMAAEMLGQADGLEYLPNLAASARHMLRRAGLGQNRVHIGDALQFDGFAGYDLIYFYKPIHDPDQLAALETRILAQARSGTILIAPYAGFAARVEGMECSPVAGYVHVTGLKTRKMGPLLRRVQAVGFGDPRPPADPPQGFVAPLAGALRAWGHLP